MSRNFGAIRDSVKHSSGKGRVRQTGDIEVRGALHQSQATVVGSQSAADGELRRVFQLGHAGVDAGDAGVDVDQSGVDAGYAVLEVQDVLVQQDGQVVQRGDAAGVVVDVGAQGVVLVGAGGQLVDLGLNASEGFGVAVGSAQTVDALFQTGEVVLADGVLFQVGDAHAQGGEVSGQFLNGVLEGGDGFAVGDRGAAVLDLLQQAGDDHGGFVAGQVLRATVGAVGVAQDDAAADELVDGVLGPVTGGNVGQRGDLGRAGGRAGLRGGHAAERQRGGKDEQAFLHVNPQEVCRASRSGQVGSDDDVGASCRVSSPREGHRRICPFRAT